jgi:hypothetical protein
MSTVRNLLLSCALLATSALPASGQDQCIVIAGLGEVSTISCNMFDPAFTEMITLTGSLEVVTQDLSNTALVSCWVCEGGSCGTSSPYGPSRISIELPTGTSGPVTSPWTVPIYFESAALADGGISFPLLASYHCHLELAYQMRGVDSGNNAPPVVPDFYTSAQHARAQQGTQLVVEFQGSFAEPVSNTRR